MSKVSSAAEDHKHHSPKSLRLIVITVSTSRYRNKSLHDESGEIAVELCRQAGHKVSYKVVDDDKQMIRIQLLKALFEGAKDGAILSGGTGLSTRDVTIEA